MQSYVGGASRAIPFNIHHPPMDENFRGLKKLFLRGCVHRRPLIFAFFLRGKAKIS